MIQFFLCAAFAAATDDQLGWVPKKSFLHGEKSLDKKPSRRDWEYFETLNSLANYESSNFQFLLIFRQKAFQRSEHLLNSYFLLAKNTKFQGSLMDDANNNWHNITCQVLVRGDINCNNKTTYNSYHFITRVGQQEKDGELSTLLGLLFT